MNEIASQTQSFDPRKCLRNPRSFRLSSRRAFTLLELMVAISIIVILIGLLTVGVRKVMTSSKVNTTRGLLQAGASLVEEWRRADSSGPSFPWHAAILPADLESRAGGLDSIGFQLSRAAMRRMFEDSSVSRLAQKMPAERFVPETVDFSGLPTTVSSWTNSHAVYQDALGYAFKGTYSGRGALTGDRFFICYNVPADMAAAAAPTDPDPTKWPPNSTVALSWSTYWMESTGAGIQMLKDAWDHPMLLVPSCGFQATDLAGNLLLVTSDGVKQQFFSGSAANFLDRLTWNTSRSYNLRDIVIAPLAKDANRWGLFMCTTNHTSAAGNQPDTAGGKTLWDRVPSIPFFASAGPDGIFFDPAKPDSLQDNIYSFEN